MHPIEIWGGIECTINRVGKNYINQILKSGHASRIDDLEQIASLGIKKLRYPFLWEHLAPKGPKKANWKWSDQRIEKLAELDIEPIVGLLHHGSGPDYTHLNDPDFPKHLADYAFAFSERYPHLKYYTPVNEPLTTARFSGLYGHWYPHGKSDLQFIKALVFQCEGIKKAMEAIRSQNSQAMLVQTEDMGKIHSTKLLQYQADFENERRWLSFDLLMGKLIEGHKMWNYFIGAGIKENYLHSFVENTCHPDILGINHYLTSERYLDHRINKYSTLVRGGNGRHRYADVEAVRVGAVERAGFYNIIKETLQRYDTPVALTEVHLGCTREEQVRWFYDAWKECQKLVEEGLPLKAITAWALLGTFDWNNLVTSEGGFYESGAFDIKGPKPRPTAIANLIKKIANDHDYTHPILQVPGWWKRDERILYQHTLTQENQTKVNEISSKAPQPIIITGASGCLAKAFAHICDVRGLTCKLMTRAELDITNESQIISIIEKYKPWAIINAAGYVHVDEAENEPDKCFKENTLGPALLAKFCTTYDIKLLTFSSSLVFDGKRTLPYLEDHIAKPLSIYGLSKKKAEKQVIKNNSDALIIRTSTFFGTQNQHNFLNKAFKALINGDMFYTANDLTISPTYIPDLVNASLDLLIDGEKGVWNLANEGAVSWSEFVVTAADIAGLNTKQIVALPSSKLNFRASRPLYSVLGSRRGVLLPKLKDSLEKYILDPNFRTEENPICYILK